jgi:hypothetical protein
LLACSSKKKIKFFSNEGVEFVNSKLTSHFHISGIIHQISYSYTPEQTGIVERQHKIIRELRMTMLFHSEEPLFLWVEAFTTAVHILNRLSLLHLT